MKALKIISLHLVVILSIKNIARGNQERKTCLAKSRRRWSRGGVLVGSSF